MIPAQQMRDAGDRSSHNHRHHRVFRPAMADRPRRDREADAKAHSKLEGESDD
jgi:hypothetical protein